MKNKTLISAIIAAVVFASAGCGSADDAANSSNSVVNGAPTNPVSQTSPVTGSGSNDAAAFNGSNSNTARQPAASNSPASITTSTGANITHGSSGMSYTVSETNSSSPSPSPKSPRRRKP